MSDDDTNDDELTDEDYERAFQDLHKAAAMADDGASGEEIAKMLYEGIKSAGLKQAQDSATELMDAADFGLHLIYDYVIGRAEKIPLHLMDYDKDLAPVVMALVTILGDYVDEAIQSSIGTPMFDGIEDEDLEKVIRGAISVMHDKYAQKIIPGVHRLAGDN